MSTKTIIAGLIGGVVSFLLGWLLYGILLKTTFEGMANMPGLMKGESDMVMWAIILGNLSMGMLFAYIFGTWASISTFMGGLRAGAIIGLFMGLAWDLIGYGTSNAYTLNGALLDVAITVLLSGIIGGVVGWWLGRK